MIELLWLNVPPDRWRKDTQDKRLFKPRTPVVRHR